jgi:NAD(P)H-hydrate epimerase
VQVLDPDALAGVPYVTAGLMREVDRLVVETAGVSLEQMMENAGRSLAELALTRYRPTTVVVLAGTGNNGGGGLAAARHLRNRGVEVGVVLSGQPPGGSVGARQLVAAEAAGVEILSSPGEPDLVIDALVGYGLEGELTGRAQELSTWALGRRTPVLSLDAPSGLDVDLGTSWPSTVRADATMTLALPKAGLLRSEHVGDLYLADISVPDSVYARLGLDLPPLFDQAQIVALDGPVPGRAPSPPALGWRTYGDAARLILRGATFGTASRIALVVGTLLTLVNLGSTIASGDVTVAVVLRVLANYAIPYVVSSLGVLSRTRILARPDEVPAGAASIVEDG